jgi:glycosyltransferase involved in cell wall biosynthesis
MRIALDATSIPPRPAGAGVYAIELVRALAERDRRDGYALFTRTGALDETLAGMRNWHVEKIAASRPGRLAWEQARLPGRLAALGIDVLHSTHHSLPLRPVRPRRVVTIHDVTFLRIPERYPPLRRMYFGAITRLSAKVADAVIVPSELVRADVVRTLGVAPDNVHVVYEAAGELYRPLDAEVAARVAKKYLLEPGYVLSVGSLEPGKNRSRLFQAMKALRDEGVHAHLAIVGQPAWKYEDEAALVDEVGMGDRIHYLGYVPPGDLPALYNAAAVFAFPSLYEGFGLPVIEAMACGVPVLTSEISATAEVAGEAGVLVDPQDVDAIGNGLGRLLGDPVLRDHYGRLGLARSARFSWRRAADETHAVYQRAVLGLPTEAPSAATAR